MATQTGSVPDEIDLKLAAEITHALVRTAIADGFLNPRGKAKADFRKEVIRYVRAITKNKDGEFQFVVDSRTTLLRQARNLVRKERLEEAILYYATWVEHTMNLMTASIARRRNLSQESVKQLVGGMNPAAKYLFISMQFTDRRPTQTYIAKIQDLAGHRNGFVHFKWAYNSETVEDEQKKKLIGVPARAETLVRHLQYLERKHLYSGFTKTEKSTRHVRR